MELFAKILTAPKMSYTLGINGDRAMTAWLPGKSIWAIHPGTPVMLSWPRTLLCFVITFETLFQVCLIVRGDLL